MAIVSNGRIAKSSNCGIWIRTFVHVLESCCQDEGEWAENGAMDIYGVRSGD